MTADSQQAGWYAAYAEWLEAWYDVNPNAAGPPNTDNGFYAGWAAARAAGRGEAAEHIEKLKGALRAITTHAQGESRRCWACGELIENCDAFDSSCIGAKARALLSEGKHD